jgi:hypothetical protein
MKSIRRGDTSIYGAIVIAFLIIIATSMFFNYIAALRNYQNNLSSSLSTILSTINAEVKFTPSGTTITITSDRYLEIIGIIAYNQSGTQYINISLGKPLAAISPTNQLDISTIVPSNIVSQVLGGNTYIAILASNGMLYTYKASSSGSGSSDLASILLNGDICSLLSDPVQRIACYINNRIYNDNASNYLVYAYGAVMQSYTTIEKVGVYFAEAPIQFTNPIATSIYSWSYSKYIGYTTWGGNYSIVVAGFYGGHGTCWCTRYDGFIFLEAGVTYTVVVRHQQTGGGRALGLYLMPPSTATWIPMDSSWSSKLSSYASISNITMTAYSWPGGYANSYLDFSSFFYSNPASFWSGSIGYIWFAGGGVNLDPPAESDFPFANIKGENFGDYIEFTLTLLVDGMWGFAVDSDDASDVLVVLPGASFSYIDERSMLDFAVRVVGIMALNDYKGLVGRVFASQILPGHVAQKILYYMADSNMFDELIYVLTSIEGTYGGSTDPWDTVLYVKSILNNPYTTYILDAPYVVVARNISGVTIKNSWGYSAPAELRPRSFGAGSMVVLASTASYSNVISDPNNLRDSMGNLRPVYGGPNGFMPSIAYNEQIYRGSGSGGGQGGPAICLDSSGTYVFYGSPGYTTVYDNPVDAIDFLKGFFKYASDIWIRYALGKSISSITSIPVYGGSRGGYGARGFYDYIYGSGGGGGGGLAILYATYSYGNIVSSPGGLGGPSYIDAGSACYGPGDGYPGQPGLAVVYYRYGNAQADLRIMMTN